MNSSADSSERKRKITQTITHPMATAAMAIATMGVATTTVATMDLRVSITEDRATTVEIGTQIAAVDHIADISLELNAISVVPIREVAPKSVHRVSESVEDYTPTPGHSPSSAMEEMGEPSLDRNIAITLNAAPNSSKNMEISLI